MKRNSYVDYIKWSLIRTDEHCCEWILDWWPNKSGRWMIKWTREWTLGTRSPRQLAFCSSLTENLTGGNYLKDSNRSRKLTDSKNSGLGRNYKTTKSFLNFSSNKEITRKPYYPGEHIQRSGTRILDRIINIHKFYLLPEKYGGNNIWPCENNKPIRLVNYYQLHI